MRIYRVTAIEVGGGMFFNHQFADITRTHEPPWLWRNIFEQTVKEMLRVIGEDVEAEWVGQVEDMNPPGI